MKSGQPIDVEMLNYDGKFALFTCEHVISGGSLVSFCNEMLFFSVWRFNAASCSSHVSQLRC